MTKFTYSSLKTTIYDYLVNDGADIQANIDTIIGFGETRVTRDLSLELFEATDTSVSTATGVRKIASPADFIKHKEILITVGGKYVVLEKRSKSLCKMFAPVTATQGVPKYWAIDESNDIYVVPTPDAVYPITWTAVKRPTPLGTSNPSNWLSDNVGDLLLYACLIEAELFDDAAEDAAKWKNEYYSNLLPAALMEHKGQSRNEYEAARKMPKPDKKV